MTTTTATKSVADLLMDAVMEGAIKVLGSDASAEQKAAFEAAMLAGLTEATGKAVKVSQSVMRVWAMNLAVEVRDATRPALKLVVNNAQTDEARARRERIAAVRERVAKFPVARSFSAVGPCIYQGHAMGETPKFLKVCDHTTGLVTRIAKSKVHTEPCSRCPGSEYARNWND